MVSGDVGACFQPGSQAFFDGLPLAPVDQLVLEKLNAGAQRRIAGDELHAIGALRQEILPSGGRRKVVVTIRQRHDALGDRGTKACGARLPAAAGLFAFASATGSNLRPFRRPTAWPSTSTSSDPGDHAHQFAAIFCSPPVQRGMPPVDEALRQGKMQGVREAVPDRLRAGLPFLRIDHPVAAIGDVGPGSGYARCGLVS